jgi:hypothetical protein
MQVRSIVEEWVKRKVVGKVKVTSLPGLGGRRAIILLESSHASPAHPSKSSVKPR